MTYIAGRYYSNTITTSASGQDLISTIKTTLGVSRVTARKIDLICSGSICVDIGNTGVWSPLHTDATGSYTLHLDEDNVFANSIKILESGRDVFIGIIY